MEGAGNIALLSGFKAGELSAEPPDTSIAAGSSSGVVVHNVAFAFESTEAGVAFECSLDGAAYSACA